MTIFWLGYEVNPPRKSVRPITAYRRFGVKRVSGFHACFANCALLAFLLFWLFNYVSASVLSMLPCTYVRRPAIFFSQSGGNGSCSQRHQSALAKLFNRGSWIFASRVACFGSAALDFSLGDFHFGGSVTWGNLEVGVCSVQAPLIHQITQSKKKTKKATRQERRGAIKTRRKKKKDGKKVKRYKI